MNLTISISILTEILQFQSNSSSTSYSASNRAFRKKGTKKGTAEDPKTAKNIAKEVNLAKETTQKNPKDQKVCRRCK